MWGSAIFGGLWQLHSIFDLFFSSANFRSLWQLHSIFDLFFSSEEAGSSY